MYKNSYKNNIAILNIMDEETFDKKFRNVDYITIVFCVIGCLNVFMLWYFSMYYESETGMQLLQEQPIFFHTIQPYEKLLLICPVLPLIVFFVTITKKWHTKESITGIIILICGIVYAILWLNLITNAALTTDYYKIFGVGCYIVLICSLIFIASGINHIENALLHFRPNLLSSIFMCVTGTAVALFGAYIGFYVLADNSIRDVTEQCSGAFTILIIFGAFLFLLGFIRLRNEKRDHINLRLAVQYAAMLGALLSILAFFDSWGSVSFIGTSDITYSGANILWQVNDMDSFAAICVLVSTVASYCAFTLVVLYFTKIIPNKIYSTILSIFGSITIIFVILFISTNSVDTIGFGTQLSLIGGVIVLAIGIIDFIFGRKMEQSYELL